MMRIAAVLVAASLLSACEDAFVCNGDCDGGSTPRADAGATRAVFVAAPLLLEERPISNGLVNAKVELRAPFSADAPANLERGAYLAPAASDLHVSVDLRYAAALLGGRAPTEMFPYLRVDLQLINNDTNQPWTTNLVPILNFSDGLRYGRNIALAQNVGVATAGYTLKVTIRRPAWFGDPDVDQFSPGVIREGDLLDNLTGTLLGDRATEIGTHFSLDDLEFSGVTTSGGGTPTRPATGGSSGAGGYIAP